MKIDSDMLKIIKNKIKELIDAGSSKTHAVSIVCDDMGLNPSFVMKKFFKSKDDKKISYKDIKTSEGSYVVLKDKPNKQYEVININNKDSIIIRDLDNNSELKVKEEEILPVVTENVMKKQLKETNYNLSIDGLETMDADTLSQILSLAGQAENGSTVEPMDMGMDSIGGEIDYVQSDFDSPETLPINEPMDDMETEEIGIEATDDEIEPSYDDFEDVGYEFENDAESVEEGLISDINIQTGDIASNNNVANKTGEEDAVYERLIPNIDIQTGDIASNNNIANKPVEEDVLLDPQSDDETYNAEKEELEEVTESEKIVDGEEITEEENNFDDEIAECLRIAGVDLNEVSDKDATKGKKDLPQVIGHKTAFSKAKKDGFKPGENQRPDYKCVKTKDSMGKESTEGFAKSMNIKEMVSKDKIESICETAARMYAKKDHSEWLALDRRYVEKLIKEGVCYSNASKMLLKAKAGK